MYHKKVVIFDLHNVNLYFNQIHPNNKWKKSLLGLYGKQYLF